MQMSAAAALVVFLLLHTGTAGAHGLQASCLQPDAVRHHARAASWSATQHATGRCGSIVTVPVEALGQGRSL